MGKWFIEETIVKFGYKALLVAVKMITQAAVLSVLFGVIYYFLPAEKMPISLHLPGAVLSACGWVIFTELYSIYVSLTDTDIYGSLSTVMLTMLWLYVCMYILLIGGEINVYLKRMGDR
jgi:membrane protein